MRTPEQTEEILQLLRELLNQHPRFRVSQIIYNFITDLDSGDPFYLTDEDLASRMKQVMRTNK